MTIISILIPDLMAAKAEDCRFIIQRLLQKCLITEYLLFSKVRKNAAFAFMSNQPGNIMKWLHPLKKKKLRVRSQKKV